MRVLGDFALLRKSRFPFTHRIAVSFYRHIPQGDQVSEGEKKERAMQLPLQRVTQHAPSPKESRYAK